MSRGLQVQESVKLASFTVVSRSENVSGVVLPTFEAVRKEGGNGSSSRPLFILASPPFVPLQFVLPVRGTASIVGDG